VAVEADWRLKVDDGEGDPLVRREVRGVILEKGRLETTVGTFE
jgi:hypothetical protein